MATRAGLLHLMLLCVASQPSLPRGGRGSAITTESLTDINPFQPPTPPGRGRGSRTTPPNGPPSPRPTFPAFFVSPTLPPSPSPTLQPSQPTIDFPTQSSNDSSSTEVAAFPDTIPTNSPSPGRGRGSRTTPPNGPPSPRPTFPAFIVSPTLPPTPKPTSSSTSQPTLNPSMPTAVPTAVPTLAPAPPPTPQPTTLLPTKAPTMPTTAPTALPTTPAPTFVPLCQEGSNGCIMGTTFSSADGVCVSELISFLMLADGQCHQLELSGKPIPSRFYQIVCDKGVMVGKAWCSNSKCESCRLESFRHPADGSCSTFNFGTNRFETDNAFLGECTGPPPSPSPTPSPFAPEVVLEEESGPESLFPAALPNSRPSNYGQANDQVQDGSQPLVAGGRCAHYEDFLSTCMDRLARTGSQDSSLCYIFPDELREWICEDLHLTECRSTFDSQPRVQDILQRNCLKKRKRKKKGKKKKKKRTKTRKKKNKKKKKAGMEPPGTF